MKEIGLRGGATLATPLRSANGKDYIFPFGYQWLLVQNYDLCVFNETVCHDRLLSVITSTLLKVSRLIDRILAGLCLVITKVKIIKIHCYGPVHCELL